MYEVNIVKQVLRPIEKKENQDHKVCPLHKKGPEVEIVSL